MNRIQRIIAKMFKIDFKPVNITDCNFYGVGLSVDFDDSKAVKTSELQHAFGNKIQNMTILGNDFVKDIIDSKAKLERKVKRLERKLRK